MNFRFPFLKRSAGIVATAAPEVGRLLGSENFGRSIRSSAVMPEHAAILRRINGRMLRMYEAAVSNNLNADFPITLSSANAEIFTSIMPTRSRARTLERDNPYAGAMLESHRVNVGGHEPFRLKMNVGEKTAEGEFVAETDTNSQIEEAWEEAGRPENCTTRRDMSRLELYLQAITAMVRDGGVLARHWRGFPKNKYRYGLQPLEIDRLDHYWQGKNPENGNDIRLSVEQDFWGGVEAFWLLTRHPGDIYAVANLKQEYRERVPAEDMIALFDLRTRAEQVVGMSRFASVIQRLHRMDQFDVAHVTAAIWASCKPFFITRKYPTAMEFVPDFIKARLEAAATAAAGGADGGGEGEKVSRAEPGMGEELEYGQEVQLVDPKFPIEAANDFKKDQLRAATAGSGTLYHQVGQDLEGVNFSSGRLGQQPHQDSSKIQQEHFKASYVRPHFEAWLKYAILSGELKLPMSRYEEFCRAAHFQGRRWPYVNPLQDVQADILGIEARLTSRSRVIAESDRGGDAEEVNTEVAGDRKSDDAHGLDDPGADPTEPALPKGSVEESGGEEKPAPAPKAGAEAAKKSGGKQTIKKTKRRPFGKALWNGHRMQDYEEESAG